MGDVVRYHFSGPGARTYVDARDAPALEVLTGMNLHHLSQVFSGQDRPRVSAALSSLSPSEAEPLLSDNAGLRRSLARDGQGTRRGRGRGRSSVVRFRSLRARRGPTARRHERG